MNRNTDTAEFKLQAIRMTAEQGLALAEVARRGLRQPAAVTFRFVEDDLAEWPVAWMSDALEVSESGDHAWAGRLAARGADGRESPRPGASSRPGPMPPGRPKSCASRPPRGGWTWPSSKTCPAGGSWGGL